MTTYHISFTFEERKKSLKCFELVVIIFIYLLKSEKKKKKKKKTLEGVVKRALLVYTTLSYKI
jgi:hypothetical protein